MAHLVWPFVIVAVAYFALRPMGGGSKSVDELVDAGDYASVGLLTFKIGPRALRAFVRNDPNLMIKLVVLSVAAFWVLDAVQNRGRDPQEALASARFMGLSSRELVLIVRDYNERHPD